MLFISERNRSKQEYNYDKIYTCVNNYMITDNEKTINKYYQYNNNNISL